MAITEDASTPIITIGTGTGVLTSASFSPPAGTLILALTAGAWNNAGTTTVSISDNGSRTWTNIATATGPANNYGVSAVYYLYLSSAATGMTVSATYTGLQGGRYLAVRVLNGAAAIQSSATGFTRIAATGTTTTDGTVSVTTTTVGSVVYGVVENSRNNDIATLNGSTSFLSDTNGNGSWNDTTDTDWFGAFKSAAIVSPGTVSYGGTFANADTFNIAAMEVLPAAAWVPKPQLLMGPAVRAAYY